MEIKEFVRKNLSVYNNVRFIEPEFKELIKNAQLELANFIVEYFEKYNLYRKDFYVMGYPNNDDFYDEFRQFHKDVLAELELQKQTSREEAKYGSHKELYDKLFDEIGFLHDLINS